MPDGDFVDLVWTKDSNKQSPIIIVLHGLEGSVHSPYAKGLLKAIEDNGWTGCFMHFRGCSGRHNLKDRGYHSGETGDIHTLVTNLKERFPNRKLGAIGVSLGGNVLLKYLGEQKDHSLIDAAFAISVPFDLADGAKSLNTGFAKVYQRHLISSLQRKLKDKFNNRACPIDLTNLNQWNDFYTFDHNVTAKLHGFESADDYYSKCSSKSFLKYITTPTHILHSKDDPFLSDSAIPKSEELSECITFELTENGGHVGFLNNFRESKLYSEQLFIDIFKL